MSSTYEVAVLVGSLRKRSFNRMLANSLAQIALPKLSLQVAEIGDLPLYNQDLEDDMPTAWQTVRDHVAAKDAALFVSPEHNRSVPALLKNAVDVLSRPYGACALTGKPAAIVTSSPGAMGGIGASRHLQQCLACLGVRVMPTPEVYIGNVADLFDEQGALVNPGTVVFLEKFIAAFSQWIQAFNKDC